jgi:hypothetical protein
LRKKLHFSPFYQHQIEEVTQQLLYAQNMQHNAEVSGNKVFSMNMTSYGIQKSAQSNIHPTKSNKKWLNDH